MTKYLIVGVGNPEAKFDGTRHNTGFYILDKLAESYGVTFRSTNYGKLAKIIVYDSEVYLLKPNNYVNDTYKSLLEAMKQLNIKTPQILLVLDDLNLDVGLTRLRLKGSPGGHNALKNVQSALGTQEYARLRVGIGNNYTKGEQIKYVLGKFTKDEQKKIDEAVNEACLKIIEFAHDTQI